MSTRPGKLNSRQLTTQIKQALALKHKDDMFMTEVKNGPTVPGMRMMDALAMKKSWTNPSFIGYEIKVSRSDYNSDQKWPSYLPMCNQLSFVCPKDMIKKEELSDEIGLIYYNEETKRFRTVRKAKYRFVEISSDMLKYILMNKVENTVFDYYDSKYKYYEMYLEHKKYTQQLGRQLSKQIARTLDSYESELRRLKFNSSVSKDFREENLRIRDLLASRGVIPYSALHIDELIKLLDEGIKSKLSPQLKTKIEELYKLIEDKEV